VCVVGSTRQATSFRDTHEWSVSVMCAVAPDGEIIGSAEAVPCEGFRSICWQPASGVGCAVKPCSSGPMAGHLGLSAVVCVVFVQTKSSWKLVGSALLCCDVMLRRNGNLKAND
jgi:hypothetical protein